MNHFLYKGDGTGLRIEKDYHFNPMETRISPSVFVGMGDITMKPNVLRNEARNENWFTDGQFISLSYESEITVRHIHRHPEEASFMAVNTHYFLASLSDYIQSNLGLDHLHVGLLSKPRLIEESGSSERLFDSSVKCAVKYQNSVRVKREENIIKKFEIGNKWID